MKTGFEVKIKKGNFSRILTLEESEITIGNSYKNIIPLNVDFDNFKLLELKDGFIRHYWNNNLNIELSKDGQKKPLKDILNYVSSESYIKVKEDVNITVNVSEYELSFKVIKLKEKYLKHVPKMFNEDVITRDNYAFICLFITLAFVLFLV